MAPTVRRATGEDARGIFDAHMRSIREVCAKDYTAEQIAAWSDREYDEAALVRCIQEEALWVVEQNGEILGFGHFRQDGTVAALYLVREAVGKGLGKRLLREIEREARRLGVKTMQLQSTVNAEGFYAAQGYQRDPDGSAARQMRGVRVPCVPMTKDLTRRG